MTRLLKFIFKKTGCACLFFWLLFQVSLVCEASPSGIIHLSIQPKWQRLIARHEKTVEGRQGSTSRGKYKNLHKGDVLSFYSDVEGETRATVMAVRQYTTIKEYLTQEGLRRTLPGIKTLADGINIYHQFYSDAGVAAAGGMLAIELCSNDHLLCLSTLKSDC